MSIAKRVTIILKDEPKKVLSKCKEIGELVSEVVVAGLERRTYKFKDSSFINIDLLKGEIVGVTLGRGLLNV